MLTKNQFKIFGQFIRNPFRNFSYKELKQLSKEKSSNAFQIAVNKFKQEKLVTETKIGTSVLYSVNFDEEDVFLYLQLAAIQQLPKEAEHSLSDLKEEIEKYILFYALVVFGSYADKTYTKSSDLDVAIIIENKYKEKDLKVAINSASKKSLLDIDCHIITQEEFLEMLKVDYENLGKQIARKNLPIHNNQIFYKLVQKGVENGFKF